MTKVQRGDWEKEYWTMNLRDDPDPIEGEPNCEFNDALVGSKREVYMLSADERLVLITILSGLALALSSKEICQNELLDKLEGLIDADNKICDPQLLGHWSGSKTLAAELAGLINRIRVTRDEWLR